MSWLYWTIKRELLHRLDKREALRGLRKSNWRCVDLDNTRHYTGHINY